MFTLVFERSPHTNNPYPQLIISIYADDEGGQSEWNEYPPDQFHYELLEELNKSDARHEESQRRAQV